MLVALASRFRRHTLFLILRPFFRPVSSNGLCISLHRCLARLSTNSFGQCPAPCIQNADVSHVQLDYQRPMCAERCQSER
jgi:hypothetical protein